MPVNHGRCLSIRVLVYGHFVTNEFNYMKES